MTSSKNSSISAWISSFVSMMCLKNLEWFRGHIPVQKQKVPVTSTIPCLLCRAHWHQQEHQGYIKMLTVMCCIVTKTRGSKNLITKIYFKKFKWQEEAFFIWLSGNSLSSGLTYQFAMPHDQDWTISLPCRTIRTDLPVCHAAWSGLFAMPHNQDYQFTCHTVRTISLPYHTIRTNLSVCHATQSGLTYQLAMPHNQDWPISLPYHTIRTIRLLCHTIKTDLSVCHATQSGLTYQFVMPHNQDWPISLPCHTIRTDLSVCHTTQSGLTYQSAMLHNQDYQFVRPHNQDWPTSLPCYTIRTDLSVCHAAQSSGTHGWCWCLSTDGEPVHVSPPHPWCPAHGPHSAGIWSHTYAATNTHGYTHHIQALWLWPVTASMQPIFLHPIWLHSSKEDPDQTLQNQPRSDLDGLVRFGANTCGLEAS